MSELNHLFETDSITVSDREEVFDRTIKDYERVLPSSNQVRWYGKNKFLTNCVNPEHEDRHPSMLVKTGHTRVVFKCYAGCSQDSLGSYFRSKLGGL